MRSSKEETVPPATAEELATRLAQSARRLRDALVQAPPRRFLDEAGLAHSAEMFAQAVVYALFAARCNGPTSLSAPDPVLRRIFDTIHRPEFKRDPFAGWMAGLTQLLDDTDLDVVLESLRQRSAGSDPVIGFYETFLAACDPGLRKACGVYYTPEPVVSFMVRAIDDLLKSRFAIPAGLAAPRVRIVDPACGTGTFLAAVVRIIRAHFLRRRGRQKRRRMGRRHRRAAARSWTDAP